MNRNQLLENIIEDSEKINSNIFSLMRIILLALSTYFIDGLQFRELKTALKVSDGKLASNLRFLIKSGYISENQTTLDKKKIKFYSVTPDGRNEIDKILKWMKLIKLLFVEEKNES
ncbi:MAG: transcriptional regulator [Promethearchaeota archaeon]